MSVLKKLPKPSPPLERFAANRNNICLAYFARNELALRKLRGFSQELSSALGIQVVLCVASPQPGEISREELRSRKLDFGYIAELKNDPNQCPVDVFVQENLLGTKYCGN